MEPVLPPPSTNETAERILAEAWNLFQSKGYRGASMDELCLRSGITKPTLYYYFRNKETLYIQTMLRQLRGYRSILEQNVALEARLAELATNLLAHYRVSVPVMLRDMEHIHDQHYHQIVNDAFRHEFLDPMIAAMEDGIARGELRPGPSTLYAWAYLGLVNTFVGDAHKHAADPDTLAAQLTDMFLNGVSRAGR